MQNLKFHPKRASVMQQLKSTALMCWMQCQRMFNFLMKPAKEDGMRKILKYPSIALIGLLFITFAVMACEKLTSKSNPHKNELNLQVSNMWNSGCKNYQEDSLKNVLITYRDSSLYINHANALLNCGYDTVNVTMSVHDNVITLSEEESPTNANCICEVDIAYSVGPVPAGTYQIIVLFHGDTIYNKSSLFQ